MKQGILIGLIAAAFATTLVALQPSNPDPLGLTVYNVRGQASTNARVALETRVTRGAPYSADAVSEFVQVLADGNRIVRRTTTRLVRDSEGRTRRETLAPNGAVEQVVITDPVSNSSLTLDPQNRTAMRGAGSFAVMAGARGRGSATAAVTVEPSGRASWTTRPRSENEELREADRRAQIANEIAKLTESFKVAVAAGGRAAIGQANRENLGQQTIEGVTATGTRTTTTVPAGAVGNEGPITIVSEQWYSTELQMLVLTKHNDPRVGETIYRVTNIVRTEPDQSLFQVPSDYTLRELTIVRPKPPDLDQ
jgi:hypothetical protein